MDLELYNKFRDIIKRIFNCMDEYIIKNINNPSLVESKLLLINNYIIGLLYTSEELQHNSYTISNNNIISNINLDKFLPNSLLSSREYEEKKKVLKKLKIKYFNNKEDKNENIILSYNDNINFNNKSRLSPKQFKIIKLKRKLKDEQTKNKIKELSYLQRLCDVQKELYLYELQKNREKEKEMNNNNLTYRTLNNTFKKRNISKSHLQYNSNKTKTIKHSISQYQIKNSKLNYEKKNNDDMKLKFELFRKKKILRRSQDMKYDFKEIKKSIEKKIDIIKSIKNNKI